MPDYELERLSTRSFEQLAQAIGLEVLGKQLMVFGDGPDGGREAAFDGPINYPEGESPWDGYGILQAKFRQRPDSLAKQNADWAIAELKKEFAKFKPRAKRMPRVLHGDRWCPEYYIFVTNLSLSAVAIRGGKDRVSALLDKYKASHGLKAYAIWDGDQIRRFLDALPAIRTTYAAWLLPGDVLAELMKTLAFDKSDFHLTIRRLLELELLDDQYAKLSQGGYTDANAIPLSTVFVDLPLEPLSDAPHNTGAVTADPARPQFLKLLFEEGQHVLRPSLSNRSQKQNSIASLGRLVLIGGPGQGKTTVGQFACQLLRFHLLRATSANYSPEVTLALKAIEKNTGVLPEPYPLRYPLRIDLKRLAESLQGGDTEIKANSVLDYLVQYISHRTDSELSKNDFRVWLKSYPWLLVLDGLDEVPPSSNRTTMLNAIRNFVSVEANSLDADLLILATTRPQGYSDEFDPSLYRHVRLAPFTSLESLHYGEKLAEARHPGLQLRVQELAKSLKRATSNPATVRLMESPLQVTIMLALIEGGGDPPEQRWKLFRDYYDVIFRREKERGTPFSALLGKYEPDIHWIHHRAGFVLQQRNASAGETAARLSHDEFERMVDDRLRKRGHEQESLRKLLVTQIRTAATDRLVFLVGNTASEIGFEIRSLQEFMAAEHCFDGPEACALDILRAIAHHPYWRNVFLFAAGRIFFEKESLIDSVILICERMNDKFADAAHGQVAFGSQLAMSLLKDGIARNQPANSRILARSAARVLDVCSSHGVSDFTPLFFGDAAEVWEEELYSRLENPDLTLNDLPWRLCIELDALNHNSVDRLLTRQVPWSRADIPDVLVRICHDTLARPARFYSLLIEHRFEINPLSWYKLKRTRSGEASGVVPDIDCQCIHAFISIMEKDDIPVYFCASGHVLKSFHVNRIDINAWATFPISIGHMDQIHPLWRLIFSVVTFARDPSPSTLASEIPAIASNSVANAPKIFPWQISACIDAIQSGASVGEIQKAVLSGEMGDASDWGRWESSPVDLATLGVSGERLRVTDGCRGLVHSAFVTWSYTLDRGFFEFIDAIADALPRVTVGGLILKTFVRVIGSGLLRSDVMWTPECIGAVEKFIVALVKRDIKLPRSVVRAIMNARILTEYKVEMIAAIGGCVSQDFVESDTYRNVAVHATEILLGCHGNREQRSHVLLALSFCMPGSWSFEITDEMLAEIRGLDGGGAESVLALNRLSWGSEVVGEVVSTALRVRVEYPCHLVELIEHIGESGLVGPSIEAFVLSIITNEELQRDSIRANAERVLGKLIERRPAVEKLLDPCSICL